MRPQPEFTSHVTTLGTGARRALALHCTMAFGGAWMGLSKAMPELTLVAPDMPSHGRSVDWDGQSSFAETVLQASLAAMDDGPMDVIGHSFGAITALRLAVNYPERVRSLTVIEPVFFAVPMQAGSPTIAHHKQASAPFLAALDAGDMETAARTFNSMWSTNAPAWETLSERMRAAMVRGVHVVPDTYDLLNEDSAGMLEDGALNAVEVPTLLIRGALAHPAIAAVNDGLVALMPSARQAIIADAGHMAPITHPEAVALEIRPLLALTGD